VDKYIDSNICPLPWNHLEVDVNGGASPCCLYKGSIPGVKVYEQSLKSIQQTEYMELLRKKFREGKRPKGWKMQAKQVKDRIQFTKCVAV